LVMNPTATPTIARGAIARYIFTVIGIRVIRVPPSQACAVHALDRAVCFTS
jgi:hypothetical protein